MSERRYAYAVQVVREDDSPAGQVPIDVDWEPAREWMRLLALRRGHAPAEALALDCDFEPLWHAERGEPYVVGFRARATADGGAELRHDFPAGYFARSCHAASTRLVAEGALKEGDRFRCLAVAFPRDDEPAGVVSAPAAPALRLNARPAAPALPIRPGSLGDLLGRSVAHGNTGDGDDVPVFVPRAVLDEAEALTRAAEAKETGGILVGHLHRDRDITGLFCEVTAQIPATRAEADRAKLTFTAEVWTDVRAALALRGRGEIMLGWWHSHPVREWCKDCPEEKRPSCVLAADFFSDHDRVLHRTVFPRAYSLGLVVNDAVVDALTFSLFGWRRGLIEPRSFHVVEHDGVAAGNPATASEERTAPVG